MVKVVGRLAVTLALIGAIGLIAACGGDDDGGDADGDATRSPAPERTVPSGQQTAAPTAAPTGGIDELAFLEASLLTAAELGENWRQEVTAAPAETAESMCGQQVRVIAPDVLRQLRNVAQGRQFTGHGISVYDDAAQAQASLAAVRDALDSGCTEYETTTRNTTTRWTVAPAEMPTIGEESIAFSVSTQFAGVPKVSSGYMVLIRNGRYVAVILDVPLTSVTLEQTQVLAQAANAKLEELAAARP